LVADYGAEERQVHGRLTRLPREWASEARTDWPHSWRSGALIVAATGLVVLPWRTVMTARAERRRHEASSGSDAPLDELTWLSE